MIGRACVVAAFAAALYGIAASLSGRRALVESGRRAVYALAVLLTVAFACLEVAFARTDLSYTLVAEHASRTTPLFYRLTAPWSAQEGSLLLWAWLLSLWSSLAVRIARRRPGAAYVQATLLTFAAFFCGLAVFLADPFSRLHPAPAEGVGLTPLLRYPSMMVHPPLLYSGYTLFAVPFAFAVGALATRQVGATWVRDTRRFALAAWLCLGVGILLGARWSYSELGWGGYWAWDPVENASLLPWLTGTAFLHSAMVQERRGMLKVWNVSLVLATGVLAVLGTFLVRSGILDSIHAFGASTLGWPFLVFIALLVAGCIALVSARARELRSEHRLDSLLSREAVFLLNNLVLVALCFVILWGTFFPLISEALTGAKASVGPPWFDRYTVPLALTLVALAGLGPLTTWRRATPRRLARAVAGPAFVAAAVAGGSALVGAATRPRALALFALAAFVVAAVGRELWRGAAARRALAGEPWVVAVRALVRANRRRWGGYTAHVGVAVALAGVAGSSAFQHSADLRLGVGQSARVGAYEVRYVQPVGALDSEKITLGALLDVRRDGRHVATLVTTRRYFPSLDDAHLGRIGRFFAGEATSEVGLKAGVARDIWAAMQPDLGPLAAPIAQADRRFPHADAQVEGAVLSALVGRYLASPPPARFRLIVSPLVSWIWIGGAILALGGLFALWPGVAPLTAARRMPVRRARAWAGPADHESPDLARQA